jgi:hypothetical protein
LPTRIVVQDMRDFLSDNDSRFPCIL